MRIAKLRLDSRESEVASPTPESLCAVFAAVNFEMKKGKQVDSLSMSELRFLLYVKSNPS